MSIKQASDYQPAGLEQFTVQVLKRHGRPRPPGIDNNTTAIAEINHGKWLANCPFCTGAELVQKDDPRFFCLSCCNEAAGGKWIKVKFPADCDQIEQELEKRTAVKNQNWIPPETVAQLRKENQKNGVV